MSCAADPPTQHFPDSRRGVLLMIVAVGVFSIMDAMLKELSGRYPVAQLSGLRGLASLPFVLIVYAARGQLGCLRMQTPSLHLLRGAIAIVMMFTFVYSLKHQTLTGVYAIFMIAPVLIVALAAILLGEQVDRGRWLAVVLGLGGVWVMLRPASSDFARGAALAALGSALCYALAALTARRLTRTDTSESMIVSFLAILALVGLGLSVGDWMYVTPRDWLLLATIGAVGAVAQHCITDAFRYASAATLAPIEYTALVYGLLIDWAVWNTMPPSVVLLGGLIVVLTGVYVVRRESR
jgi:drug/metabolite transporter (DMT)-like permease